MIPFSTEYGQKWSFYYHAATLHLMCSGGLLKLPAVLEQLEFMSEKER